MVLVEPDLFFRQYPFHTHKLVLHRASMRTFADRLRDAGFPVIHLETDAERPTEELVVATLRENGVRELTAYDVVDDWLGRDLRRACAETGTALTWAETPGFLTTDAQCRERFSTPKPRMSRFYEWQRRRLDVLVEGDGSPVGGRWSFDTENRKRLPAGLALPALPTPRRTDHVRDAIAWVAREFPDNPGDPAAFSWPTTHGQAESWLARFCSDRLALFGPYEDAIAAEETFLFHSAITPMLNIGLLDPRVVLEKVLAHGAEHPEVTPGDGGVSLASLEGFVRQVIGWREYMRAAYVVQGRAMRTRNLLAQARPLGPGWWDGSTGLAPVDTVIERVLESGYAHHIERLMVLGNAMLLLRTDPDDVHEWFMSLFVDAYDWVMVPNVYAMSQFAAGELMTTKPYVSGSNYLRKMGDFPRGDWEEVWDALYWQFVDDHRDGYAANPRTAMAVRTLDRLDPDRRSRLADLARTWVG